MKIKLNKPFTANSAVDEFDVRQVKKALNRLGYYQPYEKTGITGIPDRGVFEALKKFQSDHGLPATGTARPGDATVQKLSSEAGKKNDGQYIWRTVGDNKVRDSHAAFNGTVRNFSDSPDPGEEFNCRCWAEPVNKCAELLIQLKNKRLQLASEKKSLTKAYRDLNEVLEEIKTARESLIQALGFQAMATITGAGKKLIDILSSIIGYLSKEKDKQSAYEQFKNIRDKYQGLLKHIEYLESKIKQTQAEIERLENELKKRGCPLE